MVFDRKFTSGNLKERHYLRDLDVNGILILTGILGKCGMGKQLLYLTPTEVTIKITLFWHVTPCFSNICLPDYMTSHLKRAIIFITEYISSMKAFVNAVMKLKFHKRGISVLYSYLNTQTKRS